MTATSSWIQPFALSQQADVRIPEKSLYDRSKKRTKIGKCRPIHSEIIIARPPVQAIFMQHLCTISEAKPSFPRQRARLQPQELVAAHYPLNKSEHQSCFWWKVSPSDSRFVVATSVVYQLEGIPLGFQKICIKAARAYTHPIAPLRKRSVAIPLAFMSKNQYTAMQLTKYRLPLVSPFIPYASPRRPTARDDHRSQVNGEENCRRPQPEVDQRVQVRRSRSSCFTTVCPILHC